MSIHDRDWYKSPIEDDDYYKKYDKKFGLNIKRNESLLKKLIRIVMFWK